MQIQLGLLQTDMVVQLHQTAHAENVRMRIARSVSSTFTMVLY